MRISTNLISFHKEFGLYKCLDIFADAGFEALDFNLDLADYLGDKHDEKFYRELCAYIEKKGMCVAQCHAPFPSTFADADDKNARRFDEIKESVRYASYLKSPAIVVHPCNHIPYENESDKEKILEYNINFYKKLAPVGKQYGVKIAIENFPSGVFSSAEVLIDLLSSLNDPIFTVCFDIGHANRAGKNLPEFIKTLGSNLEYTHIHDNDGTRDAHTLPYFGKIDWTEAMGAFRQIGYTGDLNYEAGFFVRDLPVELRPEAARFMAFIAKHLRELFKNGK